MSRYPNPRCTYGIGVKQAGGWDWTEWNSVKCTSLEGDKNSSRVASECVVENSSQDVSLPLVGTESVWGWAELDLMMPETIADCVGDEPRSGDLKLKWGENSSGVVTEDDGDRGRTTTSWGPRDDVDGRRTSGRNIGYCLGKSAMKIIHTVTRGRIKVKPTRMFIPIRCHIVMIALQS